MTTRAIGVVASLICTFSVSSCATRSSLAEDFRSDRDECVGQRFMDAASWWCQWSDAIERRVVGEEMEEYLIAPDFMGRCRWIYVVDRRSRVVTGWRYDSGKGDCYSRIDWLGPW
jgi:hypothetical protein